MSAVDAAPEIGLSKSSGWTRWRRGLLCWASFLVAPFGWLVPLRFTRRVEPERLEQGLVLIFPGIEGRSFLNLSILHGLVDAGVPYALEIVDWTTGNKLLTLYHLRAWKRNQRVAQRLAQRVVDYQREYPNRPVWIVGHSGGGGMALLTAAALPEGHRLTGAILIAPAVSPAFDLEPALRKVERGIWSFHSWVDCLFVGLGSIVFGTMEGRHGPAAGMIGFRCDSEGFQQTGYHPRWLSQFHWGGHFSCVHRVFVAESIAPLIAGKSR